MGRVSTVHQDVQNINASYRYAEGFLGKEYQGPVQVKHLGEQASGMRTDRATIIEAEEEIATGTWDLVLTEDLARIYRNPRYQYAFVQNAVDMGTRVISIGDNLDTADENWEVTMGAATLRHGLHIPDTRRRVRRTATHAFHKGGMVQRIRYGYRRLTREEAASGDHGPKGLRIAKDPNTTAILREMKDRVLRGVSYVEVGDWLNDSDVSPGPYVASGLWTGRLVQDTLRCPLLSGVRTFRAVRYDPIFLTGKHRRSKNSDPEREFYPELAHFTEEEHRALLQAMDARSAKHLRRSGRHHPLFNRARSRAIWPAQHARCAICDGLMYRSDRGSLKCQNAFKRGSAGCWNHVQTPCAPLQEKVLAWLCAYCDKVPGFRATMVDTAWAELQAQRNRHGRSEAVLEKEIAELEKQSANLAQAIAVGGELEALTHRLREVERQLHNARQKKEQGDTTQLSSTGYASREEVDAALDRALLEVMRTSFDFADLMRAIFPVFRVLPVQALDSGAVRPRAFLTFRPSAFLDHENKSDSNDDVHLEFDLFEPPLHIANVQRCLDARSENPKATLRELAGLLGINYMTVKRSLSYARLMQEAGTSEPYQLLRERPSNASRWKPRRSSA